MATKINGVKGMNDLLPGQAARWQEMEAVAREVFALYGYREVRTPVVEPAQLFARGVGEATDIVKKEMYVFEDKGEDLLALRPEGTAGTVRAFIEHGAFVEGPQKWFYVGPMFRRERPQKGRYRQFHQIGCEAFGIAEPFIDAEQIALLDDYFARLGVKAELKLNTVGDRNCRPAYLQDLRAYLTGRKGELCPDCNERIERMFWAYGFRGRPARPMAEVLGDLIDASSVGGATFELGSAAFDMTRVATGQLDAYVEPGPRLVEDVPGMREEFERVGGGAVLNNSPYDLAAAVLCLEEAGAVVTDAHGERLSERPLLGSGHDYQMSCVAAANRPLHTSMLEVLDRGFARLGGGR